MPEILEVPFNRSYWIVPRKLLAGGYPGSEDPMEEERNLKGLIQAGVRHVISRQEETMKFGGLKVKRFVLPHPTAPYHGKSELYSQVFEQIRLLLRT